MTLAAAQVELAHRGEFDPGVAHAMNMGIGPSDVHIEQALSGFAVGFSNDDMIADDVLPVLPVKKESDKYWVHDKYRAFNIARTNIASQRGRPGEANTSLSKSQYATEDYGLMGFVSQSTINNADSPLDPQMIEVETIMSFLYLAREVRVSDIVFDAANYASNHATLAGADQWDNASSDPVKKVQMALDTCLVRPNVAVIGLDTFRALQSNTRLRAYIESRAATKFGATDMRPTEAMLADLFEVERVIVPHARFNEANEGDSVSLSRVWNPKSAAFIRVEKSPSPQKTGTFGYTFRLSDPATPAFAVQTWFDRAPGRSGGVWVKVTHADAEKVIAGGDGGYLFESCIA